MTYPSALCPHCFLPNTSSLVANWSFNGTTEDVSSIQYGRSTITNPSTEIGLRFENATSVADHVQQGYMRIRAPGYVNIPTIQHMYMQDASWTISWEMRIPAASVSRMVLLSNWAASMWQFMMFLDPDRRVGCTLRRDVSGGGSDPDVGLVDVMTASSIPIAEWVSIAFTFDREKRTFTVYLNGQKSNQSTIRSSVTNLDLNPSTATFFQFGQQADSGSGGTLNADIRHLRFFKLHTTNP